MSSQKKSKKSSSSKSVAKTGQKMQKKNGLGGRSAANIPLARQVGGRKTYFRTLKGSREGSVRVQGRELLARLGTSVGLVQQLNYSINPSNPLLFPRLSALAHAFEQFTFSEGGSLKFDYEAACAATNPGTLLMYHDYDATSGAAVDHLSILNNETSVESAVWNCCSLRSDTKKQSQKELYMSVSWPNTSEIEQAMVRQSYFGTVRVYSSDGPATSVFAGYLFVEYDVELITPKPPSPVALASYGPAATVAPASFLFSPRQGLMQTEGLHPVNAIGTGAPYAAAGGVPSLLDAAKTIYETGLYAAETWAEWTGATFDTPIEDYQVLGTPLESKESRPGVKIIPRKVAKKMISDDRARRRARSTGGAMVAPSGEVESYSVQYRYGIDPPSELSAPQASGDIIYWHILYDVTNGVVDPDFPVSATNMTVVSGGSQSFTATGTGSYANLGTAWLPDLVPAGKKYMIRDYAVLGATTGRTTTGLNVAITAISSPTLVSGD